ncbi:4-hydroxyphenylpyruvate dioxygenase [Pseudobacteriovorax antillogorgiicola]|uniref:4-hydroxyphenylpyruvate dioxygenase n=1 Tax=Pseudobacteriovorax antillogorgiicola TaxID=1513793 RepID=A0A1Y6CRU2_9BACT|nr:4-hydroxyphenylpyruvate dioxygenase [Pseudobacteriovorax antillogorgiicola]TCS45857.1 4-hydroxyphenylpyruvate dioxygenase [Pseudobacteriovorax antillogorgiicola]SMF71369.1 4-hydroxyphenylpyruvate dioxygenase [Pseudobacteriovorax antillogorgiicola]
MAENPVGIKGFDFIEFSTPEPEKMHQLFQILGFSRTKRHKEKKIDYYRQNDIHFFLNTEPDSFAVTFTGNHGPCACSTGWRVENAEKALKVAVERGAKAAEKVDLELDGKPIPAIYGVGESLIYFVETPCNDDVLGKMGFEDLDQPDMVESKGFHLIDHLTNNVFEGELVPLANFYKDVFGFEEVRYFDIEGEETGLLSYALRSPCGSFCIPINEGKEEKSQINEYLREYKGQGIQHIALLTPNILKAMDSIKPGELKTLDIDAEYYDEVFQRLPNVKEDHKKIRDYNLLVDGDKEGYLIQIFTENVIGPIFFEFIQRNNHYGFGEGNFGALFRAIERDQKRRGVL